MFPSLGLTITNMNTVTDTIRGKFDLMEHEEKNWNFKLRKWRSIKAGHFAPRNTKVNIQPRSPPMKKPKHPYPLPALPLQETKSNHYNSTSAIFVPPTYSILYQRRSHKEKLISTIFEVSTLNPNDYQGILDGTSQLLAFEEHHTVVRDPNDHRTSSLYGAVDESYVPKFV